MIYTICIENLKLKTIIGILEKERVKPQEVLVWCFIEYEKCKREFINYADVSKMIENMLVENRYFLIEDALEDIITNISKNFKDIKTIRLKLSKSEILDNCEVAVELFRKI